MNFWTMSCAIHMYRQSKEISRSVPSSVRQLNLYFKYRTDYLCGKNHRHI